MQRDAGNDNDDVTGQVAIVTGAGGGVGGAVARELARRGAIVVVNDHGVSVDGSGPGETSAEETAEAIRAAGGTTLADASSVGDRPAMDALVALVVERFGRIDMLVNAAGVTSPTLLQHAATVDWDRQLDTHVRGHLNCIGAVLPQMAAQGYGRILAVTSGAGLQRADAATSIYGTAKRAVAALSWRLAGEAPAGVTINALSPIANTRMIAAALPPSDEQGPAPVSTGYGLNFAAMPAPEALAPVVAYLCSPRTSWMNGQVVFTNGAEVTLVDPPALVEAVRVDDPFEVDLGPVIEQLVLPAVRTGRTGGGSMPRPLGAGRPLSAAESARSRRCLIISPTATVAGEIGAPLAASGWEVSSVGAWSAPSGHLDVDVDVDLEEAESIFRRAVTALRGAELVVVATAPSAEQPLLDGSSQTTLLAALRVHGSWTRAALVVAGDEAARTVVNVVRSSPVGTVVAHGVAQLGRSLRAGPDPSVWRALAVELDAHDGAGRLCARFLAHLHRQDDWAAELAGAELTVGQDTIGVYGPPGPSFTASLGGPADPSWLDATLRRAGQRSR